MCPVLISYQFVFIKHWRSFCLITLSLSSNTEEEGDNRDFKQNLPSNVPAAHSHPNYFGISISYWNLLLTGCATLCVALKGLLNLPNVLPVKDKKNLTADLVEPSCTGTNYGTTFILKNRYQKVARRKVKKTSSKKYF